MQWSQFSHSRFAASALERVAEGCGGRLLHVRTDVKEMSWVIVVDA